MKFLKQISKILNIDIEKYFADVIIFFDSSNDKILQFYTVSSEIYPQEAFDEYLIIQDKTILILNKIQFYKILLSNTGYWDILDKIDSIQQKLNAVKAYPKYNKVNFLKTKDSNSTLSETYVLRQNESLENISEFQKNSNWSDIAIYNELKEEDYTSKGGVKIILKSSINSILTEIPINSIVDIAVGRNLLGKDFPSYFEFNPEENDIFVETPEQTFLQSAKRLLKLNVGSIPEFPNIGIQKDIISESVKGDGFLFPLLLRQLMNTLDTDDTIINLVVTDIKKEEGSLFVMTTFTNRLGDNLYLEEKI